ncbi:hypothetical protein FJTKL_05585 [Diaporthe vaccinii]|uniref:Uncharacterized protein n=1 Tax=Diaporthe vaccinii TaxID=105482 RepID=A0ABR4DRL5_9PEZI
MHSTALHQRAGCVEIPPQNDSRASVTLRSGYPNILTSVSCPCFRFHVRPLFAYSLDFTVIRSDAAKP